MNVIQKLSQINAQDISLDKIRDQAVKYPTISINILLIAVSVFAIILTYNHNTKKIAAQKADITEIEKKAKIVGEYKVVRDEYAEFIKNFPKPINSDQLMTTISDYAIKNNVAIISYSPASTRTDGIVNFTNIGVNLTAKEYGHVINFITTIEETPYAIRVKKWSGSMNASNTKDTDVISFSVEIEAIQINE